MTWIDTTRLLREDPEARERLNETRRSFPPEYGQLNSGKVQVPPTVARDSIVAAHGLVPAAMEHTFRGLGALYAADGPPTRRQQEMIAVQVSTINDCFY